MNKLTVYDVELAAKITVAAYSPRQAAEKAARILDNPLCFVTYVHHGFMPIKDPMELEGPKHDEPAVDDEPIPF